MSGGFQKRQKGDWHRRCCANSCVTKQKQIPKCSWISRGGDDIVFVPSLATRSACLRTEQYLSPHTPRLQACCEKARWAPPPPYRSAPSLCLLPTHAVARGGFWPLSFSDVGWLLHPSICRCPPWLNYSRCVSFVPLRGRRHSVRSVWSGASTFRSQYCCRVLYRA